MAAPPARARADYDYLIKLLLIGDSGMFSLFQLHHQILVSSVSYDIYLEFGASVLIMKVLV